MSHETFEIYSHHQLFSVRELLEEEYFGMSGKTQSHIHLKVFKVKRISYVNRSVILKEKSHSVFYIYFILYLKLYSGAGTVQAAVAFLSPGKGRL